MLHSTFLEIFEVSSNFEYNNGIIPEFDEKINNEKLKD